MTTPMTDGQTEDAATLLQSELTQIMRTETGLHESLASLFAAAAVTGLRRNHGGASIYIPSIGNTERDRAILREFDGTNPHEICQRYDISRSRLYQIAATKTTNKPQKSGFNA